MILPFTLVQLALACLVGLMCVVLGLIGRKPNDVTVLALGVVEVLLLAQIVTAILAPGLGNPPSGSPLEFWLYLVSAAIIPPQFRPRVAIRYGDQNELLVSGLLQGGGGIAQRPLVVDVPVDQGHVVLFANNPVWRGSTVGSYFLVFNAILNWDNLNAGRVLDVR